MMKKTMTLVVCLIVMVATANAQTLKNLFEKYAEDERFEYVSVGEGMLASLSSLSGFNSVPLDDSRVANNIKILSLSDIKKHESLSKSILSELDKIVEKGNFKTIVETHNKEERVTIYNQENKNEDPNMLIVTIDKLESSMSIIWLKGKNEKSGKK